LVTRLECGFGIGLIRYQPKVLASLGFGPKYCFRSYTNVGIDKTNKMNEKIAG
jgi:hypothetical protein